MNRVPKLRFPEFSGEWEEKKLGEICDIVMGQSPSSLAYNQSFEGLPLIQGNADCKNRKIVPRVYTSEITKESIDKDIIMSVRAPAGTVAKSNIHSCIGRGVCAIREKTENQEYIFQYLINYEDEWSKYSQGSTFDSINSNDVKGLNVPIPSLPEQQEIASLLSSVDSKIEKLERKKELWEQYKKGMMQKIFSQELRFKDENGEDYPEWEEKRLGEISDVRDGTHDSPKYIEKGYPFITSKNLMANGQINFKDINYISKEDYISINKRSQVTKGDILFGMIGTIGNPVIVTKEGFAIKNVALIKEQNNLKNNFLLQLLKSSTTEKQFHILNAGGTQKFISLGLIRDLEFNIPSLPEQEKIANFLSSIDRKIELVEQELEKNKEFKKGLLQQIFV